MGTYSKRKHDDDDEKPLVLGREDFSDDEEYEEFMSFASGKHFKDFAKKHSVHDPYDQVYSTAVFTPPVYRDFLMEDMVGIIRNECPHGIPLITAFYWVV